MISILFWKQIRREVVRDGASSDLPKLVSMFRDSKASDPRDKIHALLNLATKESPLFLCEFVPAKVIGGDSSQELHGVLKVEVGFEACEVGVPAGWNAPTEGGFLVVAQARIFLNILLKFFLDCWQSWTLHARPAIFPNV